MFRPVRKEHTQTQTHNFEINGSHRSSSNRNTFLFWSEYRFLSSILFYCVLEILALEKSLSSYCYFMAFAPVHFSLIFTIHIYFALYYHWCCYCYCWWCWWWIATAAGYFSHRIFIALKWLIFGQSSRNLIQSTNTTYPFNGIRSFVYFIFVSLLLMLLLLPDFISQYVELYAAIVRWSECWKYAGVFSRLLLLQMRHSICINVCCHRYYKHL